VELNTFSVTDPLIKLQEYTAITVIDGQNVDVVTGAGSQVREQVGSVLIPLRRFDKDRTTREDLLGLHHRDDERVGLPISTQNFLDLVLAICLEISGGECRL
jgi:hypothetical protein